MTTNHNTETVLALAAVAILGFACHVAAKDTLPDPDMMSPA